MLLDDTQVAIDELLTSSQESAAHYADAAQRVEGAALRELFESIATQRRDDAERLAQAVKDTDRLPRAPYVERQELHQLVTHARAAIAGDEMRVLLDDRINDERNLRTLVDKALQHEPTAGERDEAQRIGAHADEALARILAEVRSEPHN